MDEHYKEISELKETVLQLSKELARLKAENDLLKSEAVLKKSKRVKKLTKAEEDNARSRRWAMAQWARGREKVIAELADDIAYIREHEPDFEIPHPDDRWYEK